MIFDAATLARGWLSVALACGADKEKARLYRTVSVEKYHGGIRLAATDGVVLLTSWVPEVKDTLVSEPGIDEVPQAAAMPIDLHGRGKGFLRHVLNLAIAAAKADVETPPPLVTVTLGVTDAEQPVFEGLESRYVELALAGVERVRLVCYEGDFPPWRKAIAGFEAHATTRVSLAPEVVGRLAKLGKVQPGTRLGFGWGGPKGAAAVDLLDSFPAVSGLVMPCQWDFDADGPAAVVSEDDE